MTNDIIFMFDSVTEAAKFINCQSTNISKASKNKNKIVKGYKIEYNIKEQENLETNLEDNQDE